jgi:uncharacterized protein (TIGR00297 family)
VATGALVAAAIAALAWGLRTLTGGGALAAWLVGTLILAGTGWPGAAALLAFFVSSSLVSRFEPADRSLDPKGSRRDAAQVIANGGAAALAALLGPARPELALWLVTGTLAAAAADTWATSLGRRSRTAPRHLLSGRTVPPGTSGGVTVLGSGAALVGAALVAGSGAAAGRQPVLFPIAALVGFLGMALDSALGATLQGRFHCPACDLPSEWPVHRCGTRTLHRGGSRWLDNDGVNFAATLVAGALAWVAWAWRCPCS